MNCHPEIRASVWLPYLLIVIRRNSLRHMLVRNVNVLSPTPLEHTQLSRNFKHAEQVPGVRRAVVDAAAVVAECCLTGGTWPELLPGLQQMAISPEAGQRESALALFRALADSIPVALESYFEQLLSVFVRGLHDSDAGVRSASVQAFGSILGEQASPANHTAVYSVVYKAMHGCQLHYQCMQLACELHMSARCSVLCRACARGWQWHGWTAGGHASHACQPRRICQGNGR
jgi:hypothetical protein